jgi:MFS family permease
LGFVPHFGVSFAGLSRVPAKTAASWIASTQCSHRGKENTGRAAIGVFSEFAHPLWIFARHHFIRISMSSSSNLRLRGACFAQFAVIGIVSTFEGVFMKERGIGEAMIGLIGGLGTGIITVFGLFWARMADRRTGEEKLIATGFVCGAVGLALLPFCETPLGFSLNVAFRGLTIPMAFALMPSLAVARLGPSSQGSRYARYRQFGSAGFVVGTLVIPLLVNDIRSMFWLASVILLAAGSSIATDSERKTINRSDRKRVPISWTRPLVTFLMANFFVGLTMPAMFGFFALYARSMGADKVVIGFLAGSNGLIALAALPLMGRIVDQFGVRRLLWLAFAAHPIRLLVVSLASNYWWLFAAQTLHLFTFAGYDVASVLYVSRNVAPENRATAQAMLSTTRMAGVFVGAILTGYLAEHAGYVTMYRVIAALTSLGLVAYMIGLRGQPPLKPVYGQPLKHAP